MKRSGSPVVAEAKRECQELVESATPPLLSMEPFYYLGAYLGKRDQLMLRLVNSHMKHRVDESLRISLTVEEISIEKNGELHCMKSNGIRARAEDLLATPFKLFCANLEAHASNVYLSSNAVLDGLLRVTERTAKNIFGTLRLTLDNGDYSQEKFDTFLKKTYLEYLYIYKFGNQYTEPLSDRELARIPAETAFLKETKIHEIEMTLAEDLPYVVYSEILKGMLMNVCYSKLLFESFIVTLTAAQMEHLKEVLIPAYFPIITEDELANDPRRPILVINKINDMVLHISNPAKIAIMFFDNCQGLMNSYSWYVPVMHIDDYRKIYQEMYLARGIEPSWPYEKNFNAASI